MYQAIGIIELKSIAKGIEATDAALKSGSGEGWLLLEQTVARLIARGQEN